MTETEGTFRHLVFFEELAKSDSADPAWPSITAGLVVMRLADEWVSNGTDFIRPDSWSVTSAREGIATVTETPLRRILTAILDTMVSSTVVDVHALNPKLMAYGQALEYDAKWALAADVYRTVIAYAHPLDDADLVVSTHIQLAFCLRNLGKLDASAVAYGDAARVAGDVGDLLGVLRARLGDAKTAIARGNMPSAEQILDAAIASAREHGLRDVHSHALHERAHVAGLRGEFERSIQFAHAALDLAPAQRQKDRILNDIATSFMYLGLLDVARDAYLVLVATAQEQYIRWLAELNLIEIAAKQQQELQFDRYRRDLESADFQPHLRVVYLLHVGRGYHALGKAETGVRYLQRAVALAEEYRFNQLLFESEQALTEAKARTEVAPAPEPPAVTRPVQDVIDVIEDMRQFAGAF